MWNPWKQYFSTKMKVSSVTKHSQKPYQPFHSKIYEGKGMKNIKSQKKFWKKVLWFLNSDFFQFMIQNHVVLLFVLDWLLVFVVLYHYRFSLYFPVIYTKKSKQKLRKKLEINSMCLEKAGLHWASHHFRPSGRTDYVMEK